MSKRTLISLLLFIICSAVSAVPDRTQRLRADTLRHTPFAVEIREMGRGLYTSTRPVEIRQQGRRLCVVSPTAQLLPVYTGQGTLYTAFHLNRGTNWLNGLPRGSYIINNKRIAIN